LILSEHSSNYSPSLQYLSFKYTYLILLILIQPAMRIVLMSTNEIDISEEITSTNKSGGKNPDEVIYGRGEVAEDDEEYRCSNLYFTN
jgi:hypothetical protein